MGVTEMRAACRRLLAQARAVRAAYPDVEAMRQVPITPVPAGAAWPDLWAALRYLWAEMVLVRDGEAGGVGVLDDEIAHTEFELARLGQ